MDDIIAVLKWFFEWSCCGHVIIITICGTMTFKSTFQVFTHYINTISCENWCSYTNKSYLWMLTILELQTSISYRNVHSRKVPDNASVERLSADKW